MHTQRTVLREKGRAGSLIVVAVALALIGVALLAGDSQPGDAGPRVTGAAFLIAGIGAALWSRRSVVIDNEGVVLRYVVRSRRLAWSDVRSFEVLTIRRNGGALQARPVAELMSGETVIVPGADPMWFPTSHRHAVLVELERCRRAAEQ
jgi:hypothetical protein